MSGLDDTSCSYKSYLLDFEKAKIRKKMFVFKIDVNKSCLKTSDIVSAPWCWTASFEIQPDMSSHVNKPAAAGIILKTFSALLETFMPLEN